jgi:hypothetical protein
MSNPQDKSTRSEQNDKPKSGQPTEPGSKSESRQGQGGRPSQEFPKSDERNERTKPVGPGDTDDDSNERDSE